MDSGGSVRNDIRVGRRKFAQCRPNRYRICKPWDFAIDYLKLSAGHELIQLSEVSNSGGSVCSRCTWNLGKRRGIGIEWRNIDGPIWELKISDAINLESNSGYELIQLPEVSFGIWRQCA